MRLFFVQLLSWWPTRLMIIGLCLLIFGKSLNCLVIRANDNIMPVATTRAEVAFIIGANEYFEGYKLVALMKNTHRPITSDDKLSYLSDRIAIIPNETSALVERACTTIRLNECPLSASMRIASIGDIMIWTGISFLFLAQIVLLLKLIQKFLFALLSKTIHK